jgi:pimeloyl-ACP methyl ester carboxylesterase
VLLAILLQSLDAYLAERDPAARAKLLPTIKLSLAQAEAELRTSPRRPPAERRGELVRKAKVAEHPLKVPFEYALFVPPAYAPEKTWRLLVSLHGQSGNGPDFSRNWLDDLRRDGETFLLCPSAGRGGWGRSLLGHAYILDSLRDVMASYAIDPDRVFLDGASMGGNGSFEFVCQYPDLFAGAAPRSGGPLFRFVKPGAKEVVPEGLENLAATPLYWTFGAKDPKLPYDWVKTALAKIESLKLDVVVKEHPNGGHEWFPQENAAVLAWMKSKTRTPYPPRVAVSTSERRFGRRFWLEITEFKAKENVQRRFGDLEGKVIEERMAFQEEATVSAELAGGEVRVASTGAKALRLYLHERMLDVGKPLVVSVNGRRTTVTPKASMEALLESARRAPGLIYTHVVNVSVP